ncbi:MAG: DinB family protein [Bryobacteraceae bacterium]
MESTGLDARERSALAKLLEWSAGELLRHAVALKDHQWLFRPEPAAWSLAQVVEHLILTERGITARLAALTEKYPPSAARQNETAGKEELILRTLPDRKTPMAAPSIVEPHQEGPLLVTLEDFLALRNRSIAYIRTTTHDLHGYYSNHAALNVLDGYQWYLLIAVHTERHAAQIAEYKSHPGFPA